MEHYRLPVYIRPTKYTINIEPLGPDYAYFNGKCVITYTCEIETNEIILHAVNIKIKNAYIVENEIIYNNTKIIYDSGKEKIKFVFVTVPKNAILIIDYIGMIYDEPVGLCKVKQKNEWTFYTHFEAVCARKCFPCFDEPNFKATFNIELLIPRRLFSKSAVRKNKFVISNTMIKEKIFIGGNYLYKFEETPLMSTYIVAFYIGQIKYSEGESMAGIKIRIFSNRPKKYRQFILENTVKCLDTMIKYFDFPYVIPKMDIVYVPKLEMGAMENWGMIIVKQEDGYGDEDENEDLNMSPLYKINETYTIIHEMVHQWFGNLVTIKWWSDLWLTESFATWFGWLLINIFYPNWKSYEQFYTEQVLKAYKIDYLLTSHAIESEINTSDGINEVFDAINYAKGSAIINMLVKYIGFEIFIKSIRYYIKKFQYTNTSTNDFINCVEYISKKPIGKIMKSWLTEKNYPIINVSLVGTNALHITQEVFTLLKPLKNKNIIWEIPLTKKLLLNKKSETFSIDKFDSKINKNACGFYVVNYEPIIIKNLLENKFDQLTDLDIAEIMNNINLCLRANKLNYFYYLDFLDIILKNLIGKKPNGLLTEIITRHFCYFRSIVKNDLIVNKYIYVITPYIDDILNSLGLIFGENEDNDTIISRINALDTACIMGIKKYVDYCNNIFDKYMEMYDNKKNMNDILDPNIENIIVQNALINRTKGARNKVFNFLMKMSGQDGIKMIVSNITFTPDVYNYQKALELIFSDKVSMDNKLSIIINAGYNIKLNKYLWFFVKENWTYIHDIFVNTQFSFIRIIEAFAMIVDDDNLLVKDIEIFFMKKGKKKLVLTVARTIEYITINTNFNNLFK
jgi:aminopeptidase N